jgi:hypothetical protein
LSMFDDVTSSPRPAIFGSLLKSTNPKAGTP